LDGASTDALRVRLRQEKALPLWTDFCHWLEEQRDAVLPKSPMGQAIRYTLGNWEALVRYTEAGFLAIDNNVAEREMKKIAIGRKNFLFVGSDKGGRTAAVLFSFTSSCQRHDLDPFAYLRDVLSRLANAHLPADDLTNLLPDRWTAPADSPAIR
jgi:transposase